MRGPSAVVVIVVGGLTAVAGLTAIEVADVASWVSLCARVGIGLVAIVAGLLINKIVKSGRRHR